MVKERRVIVLSEERDSCLMSLERNSKNYQVGFFKPKAGTVHAVIDYFAPDGELVHREEHDLAPNQFFMIPSPLFPELGIEPDVPTLCIWVEPHQPMIYRQVRYLTV